MSQGAMNCPFLTLTARPVRPAAWMQVGLPGQESRYLEQIADLGHRRRLMAFMDVRGDRQAGASLHGLQRPQARLQSRTAKRLARGPVGLVERRLEHQRQSQTLGQFPQPLGNPQRQIVRLDDARSGDPEQRLAGPADNLPDRNRLNGVHK